MGCGTSGSLKNKEGAASPEVLEAYLGLEQAIWREENKAPAPGPALSFANARLEALNAELQAAEERLAAWSRSPTGDESIRQVVVELAIHRNEQRSAEHEEFIANINRQALARNEVVFLERRREEAEEEVKMLISKVNYLQGLYQEEDTLLGELFGEAYGNEEEKRIELELDKLRSYRDTLSGGELEWHEAATLIQSATELLERAVTCWKQINSQTPETRIHLCIDARNCIQEAAICVQSAQALLPGVQFPYCTAREINAVLQAVVYIFTDIQIPDRYSHAGQCYNNFHQRSKALSKWMKETIDQSLRKDLADVDRKVAETTEHLRKLRVTLIRHKMGDYSMEGMAATPAFHDNAGVQQQPTSDRFLNPQQPLRPAFTPSKFKMRSRQGNLWSNQEIDLSAPNHWTGNQWEPSPPQIPGQWAPTNQMPGGQWNCGN